MHKDEIKILEIFKARKKAELSTTDIIADLYPDNFKKISDGIKPMIEDKGEIEKNKRLKAQLHRKTLYHINKLVGDDILKVERTAGKGQKFFALTIGSDEDIIIEKTNRRKIVISKPQMPAMPIEGYEQKNLIKKFEEATWINRVNAYILQCKCIPNIEKLKRIIKESFSYINDVLGINDFEVLIEKSSRDEMIEFLESIEQECRDYGKTISYTIDFTNITDPAKIDMFTKIFSDIKPINMNVIFDMNSKELLENESLMLNVVENFSKSRIQVYIKDQDCHDAPYMLGRAGPYTIEENDWAAYREEYGGKMTGIAFSQSTISVDVKRFFENSTDKGRTNKASPSSY